MCRNSCHGLLVSKHPNLGHASDVVVAQMHISQIKSSKGKEVGRNPCSISMSLFVPMALIDFNSADMARSIFKIYFTEFPARCHGELLSNSADWLTWLWPTGRCTGTMTRFTFPAATPQNHLQLSILTWLTAWQHCRKRILCWAVCSPSWHWTGRGGSGPILFQIPQNHSKPYDLHCTTKEMFPVDSRQLTIIQIETGWNRNTCMYGCM